MYFRIFTRILLITANNPRTDIAKPGLQMHWYRLCDDILEYNGIIFGENKYHILGIENEKIDNQMLLL